MKRIVHICFVGAYTEGMSYQENILPFVNSDDGHQVFVIAEAFEYKNGIVVETSELKKRLKDNLLLIRTKYDKIFNNFFSIKIRKVKKLKKLLEEINPDIIFFHGVQSYELLTVSKYKSTHPNVKLYTDNHADFNNSARNIFSKIILHKLFYNFIIHKCLKDIDKCFYITEETKKFLENYYKIPKEKLEFYPLGGFIKEENLKSIIRKKIREDLKILNNDIILIHSGKLDKLKRTKEILKAFMNVKNEKLHLLIIGSIPDEERNDLESLINLDKRIKFLGWKSGEELLDYICASDIYVQPGSQSATCQNAVCCGLPIILYPHISYKKIFNKNVFWVETENDIEKTIKKIVDNPNLLKEMSSESYKIAKEILDYKKLAARLYK